MMVWSQSGIKAALRGQIAPPHHTLPSYLEKEEKEPIGSPWARSVLPWPVQVKTTLIEVPGTAGPAAPFSSPSPPRIPSQHRKIAPPSPFSKPWTTQLPLSLQYILQGCWAQLYRLCTAQGHLVQGDTTCILDLYIYYSNFPNLEEGVPFPYSHKGTTGANDGPAILDPVGGTLLCPLWGFS